MIEEINLPQQANKETNNTKQPTKATIIQEEKSEENVTQNKDGSCPQLLTIGICGCIALLCPCSIPIGGIILCCLHKRL
jgi:hypothetical protein